jgi:ABC-type nitrate/sulfonate/bicarbonate transport system substrate-binding protein
MTLPRPGATAWPVTLIVFPGGFNWPVWVAADRGLFSQRGLAVKVVETPGSVFQWTSLANGESQIAITLMDNVIAYREGQGQPGIVVEDAVALMALDTRAMPALVTMPDVRTYADLRGRTLAVDALLTGNALVLMGMLERGGLRRDEYRLEQAGGVIRRFEAIQRGEYAGSLFNSPFQGLLQRLGFNTLDTATSLLSHFQGHVVAARKAWADANRPVVTGFLRAIADALEWLYDPQNRRDAFAIYSDHMAGEGFSAAATAYSVLFDPVTGFPKDGALDAQGIDQVLELRARYGQPRKALGDAYAYSDAGFLAEAIGNGR